MPEDFKICPICETRNQRQAVLCSACGTTLANVAPQKSSQPAEPTETTYDYRLGESDLAEESLNRAGRIMSVFLILLIFATAALVAVQMLSTRTNDTGAADAARLPTIKPPHIAGPTVTHGPPTATYTSSPIPTPPPTSTLTPSPCVRKVAAGDSLIAIVSRCGHRNLAILPTVMKLNGITDETRIQIGQEIIVPLPSPTRDPADSEAPTTESEIDSASADPGSERLALPAFDPFAPTVTPTLLPGLMWHIVQPDENMIVIALQYETNAKALSDLNPEIEFSLCDFGLAYGGPECTVPFATGTAYPRASANANHYADSDRFRQRNPDAEAYSHLQRAHRAKSAGRRFLRSSGAGDAALGGDRAALLHGRLPCGAHQYGYRRQLRRRDERAIFHRTVRVGTQR